MAKAKKTADPDRIVCTLQGGGALGAYQVGVLEALNQAGYHPDWFVGTSIGAINAAIAAGNPPETRIEKLKLFWNKIATPSMVPDEIQADDIFSKRFQHYVASQLALFFGQPGFFHPQFPPPQLGWHDTPDKISYYSTALLKETLASLVDFDRINQGKSRLSVGAVNVETGQMVYFDSLKQNLTTEHIMASGALPPGFPAVEIDGQYYWDGGISSNSPLGYVLNDTHYKNALCFLVHLFDSYGMLPGTIDEVLKRKKDIEFSSRFIRFMELYQVIHSLKYTIHKLSESIPEEIKKLDHINQYLLHGWDKKINLVRFLYESDESDLNSKDFEFSRKSIKDRMHKGFEDATKGIELSPWKNPVPQDLGIALHDMSGPKR